MTIKSTNTHPKGHVLPLVKETIETALQEIPGIQDALEKIAAEAKEDGRTINVIFQKLLHKIQQRL